MAQVNLLLNRASLRELFAVIHRREKMTATAFQKALEAAREQVMKAATTHVPATWPVAARWTNRATGFVCRATGTRRTHILARPASGRSLTAAGRNRADVRRPDALGTELALPAKTQPRMVRLDAFPLELNRVGQLFFQPGRLHLQATDLLVQFGDQGVLVLDFAASIVGEQFRRPVEQAPLPLADLGRGPVLWGQYTSRKPQPPTNQKADYTERQRTNTPGMGEPRRQLL